MGTIGIASDHAGFELKSVLIEYLQSQGYQVKDFGTFTDRSVDYPEFAHALAKAIENNDCYKGIAICGSGNGVNMTVNKHQKIRSALCWNQEIAALAIEHNNANICALPARFIEHDKAKEIVSIFLKSEFEGGRHQNRIDKIPLK